MSVGRRLMVSLVTLVACTALLGAAAVAGLISLSRHYQVAEEQYKELRSVYEIGFQAASVRQMLSAEPLDRDAIHQHLFLAAQEADKLAASRGTVHGVPGDQRIETLRLSIVDRLNSAADAIDPRSNHDGLEADVNQWLGQVASLASAAQHQIIENRRQTNEQFRTVLLVVIGLFSATAVAAAIVGVRQYRSVMRPLRALDNALTEIAGIHLSHRIDEHGDREFRRLMHHFNRMSSAIEHLHASMQHQVEVKSRQLVRSEQLASVGTLAAGIAHEINNPLAIIAGHAQSSLRRLERAQTPAHRAEAVRRAEESLAVIAEEAFRCKDIALQLVRMAQPADGSPGPISLDALTRQTIDLIAHLSVAKGRGIVYQCDGPADDMICAGHAPQLLQVLINLITNALEASTVEHTRVVITLSREEPSVLIAVTDSGCGMTEGTLAHAFDPFFTDKPRRGLDGCGLGLSISHAIIERHAGRLYAHSDGPGCGSTFTVELPALPPNPSALARSEAEHIHV